MTKHSNTQDQPVVQPDAGQRVKDEGFRNPPPDAVQPALGTFTNSELAQLNKVKEDWTLRTKWMGGCAASDMISIALALESLYIQQTKNVPAPQGRQR